ncbi:hypothetical protein NPIL_341331 [Nephila pilipes]|uniref:Uncharacterized protein n=1 Tax=Nephila pilipes TaxID=299642 RepID=A0A8X6Q1D5_NEPPI|nr:hypothetical protein NPIL_341331 [Nephila pilipes]
MRHRELRVRSTSLFERSIEESAEVLLALVRACVQSEGARYGEINGGLGIDPAFGYALRTYSKPLRLEGLQRPNSTQSEGFLSSEMCALSFRDIPELPVSRDTVSQNCVRTVLLGLKGVSLRTKKKERKFLSLLRSKIFSTRRTREEFCRGTRLFLCSAFWFLPFKGWKGRCCLLLWEMCPHVNTFACPSDEFLHFGEKLKR